jgi:hypothetical protein
MKLSEAIREGAKKTRQCFNFYIDDALTGLPVATCALGAAADVAGLFPEIKRLETLSPMFSRWPILDVTPEMPCNCGGRAAALSIAIAHLNDAHRWSREAIAEWVEVIEGKADEVAVPAAVSHECGQLALTK